MNYFNYFSEIEETFNRRRGKYLFLSPIDWALIESWQERGVPLHVILRGIEKVFDGVDSQPKRRRSVKSLMYCREEIEAQYEEWLERQIGKSQANGDGNGDGASGQTGRETSLFSDENLRAHLENAALGLASAQAKAEGELREVLLRAAGRLAELEKNFADAESLEQSLNDLEQLIDAALLQTADEKTLAPLKAETEKRMAQYRGKMEKEVFDRTFDLMLLKHLREAAEIPRLSLFYL
ncbi:MAG: hypothetical protein M3384_16345 [Acidobacteriota bacterium]|nr:hypothetical protein [Acidobacteriota bacterium]